MGLPAGDVWCIFGSEGIQINAVEKNRLYQRTLTWKELKKMALRGTPLTKGQFTKHVSAAAIKVVKSNNELLESLARSRKGAEEGAQRLAKLQSAIQNPGQSVLPLPPVPKVAP